MPGTGPGQCSRCYAYAYIRDVREHCQKCANEIESQVTRLTKQWSSDLDLMAQFDAFYTDRVEGDPDPD